MFDRLTFKAKMVCLVTTAVAGLLSLLVHAVWQVRQEIDQGQRAQLVAVVDSARAIVAGFQAEAAAGLLSKEQAQAAAKAALRSARFGPEGKDYYYVWTMDGVGVMHPIKPEWEGRDMSGKILDGHGNDLIGSLAKALRASRDGSIFLESAFARPGSKEVVPKLQRAVMIPEWNWFVGTGLYQDVAVAQQRQALLRSLAIGLPLMGLIAFICWSMSRALLRQIGGDPGEARAAMARVAGGDLSVELGPVPADSLLGELKRTVQSLRTMVGQVRSATESIATASAQIAAGGQDLSRRTEQTAAQLQHTASAVEQLSGTVDHTAGASRNAAELASQASGSADRGGRVVHDVVQTMAAISASAGRIGDITGVIDGAQPGAALGAGGAGDQGADRRVDRPRANRRRTRAARRRRDERHRRAGAEGRGHHPRDLGRRRRAVGRAGPDQPLGRRPRRGHAAQRRAGRGIGRGRRQPAGAGPAPGRDDARLPPGDPRRLRRRRAAPRHSPGMPN